jgi:hypothetical protein
MKAQDSELKITESIERSIADSKGLTSPSNIAADTGYSIDVINDHIHNLLEIFEAKVIMNKNTGSLEFKFHYPLKRRSRKSFRQIMYKISVWLWEIFKKVYRASFGIILIFYTVLFLIILLGGKSSDRKSSGSAGSSIGGVLEIIGLAFRFIAIRPAYEKVSDSRGFKYRKPAKEKNKGKSLIMAAFNYVLGPERKDSNPLDNAKEVIAYVKLISKGRLTAADIVHLSGVSYDESESLLAEYAGKYKGELNINDNGYVECYFPNLINEKIKTVSSKDIVFYQDEIDAPYEHNGNSTGKNITLTIMNVFNLLMSFYMFSVLDYPIIGEPDNVLIVFKIVLAYFPFIFSLSFYLIPIIRIPFVNIKENQRKRNIVRKFVFRYVLNNSSQPFNLDKFTYEVEKAEIDNKTAGNILNNMIIDLRGTVLIGDNGEKLFDFTKFNNELTSK